MDFVLHSVNGSYPPPPDFDKAAESAVFTKVMSTFTWLPETPTPTPVPATATPTFTPTVTPTPTSPTGDWLGYTNSYYGFQFLYPPRLEDHPFPDPNYARIDLPFAQGTNLREKYLEVFVTENASTCLSPFPVNPIHPPQPITINGIPFLKQTESDAGVGHIHQWVAYSTRRDNVCVSLNFTLHWLQPGNFATPPPVFDFAYESAVFDVIVSTFTWLPSTPVPSPTATATATPPVTAMNLVDALNARNYDALKALMNQTFVFAFWQSEGTSYPPDLAIEQLQTNYISATTHLTADPSKNLNILLGGLDPYAIMGLDPAKSQALFVSGWGLSGNDEALLYMTTRPDGSLYWHGVLIAPGGFVHP